ncbi:MAG: hypothetical protein JXA33_00535 [Anaerolineae bacterium]|nr:hypothetical protein [Anaerolineae bacterium]
MSGCDEETKSVFNPGKARWLQESGGTQLSVDQLALLLALAQLETELGRPLSQDEQVTIETLGEQLEGFHPKSIIEAVHQMVQAPTDPARKTSWPELKHRK